MNMLSKILDFKRRWLVLAILLPLGLFLLPKPAFAAGGFATMVQALIELAMYAVKAIAMLMQLAATTIMSLQFYTERQLAALKVVTQQKALAGQVVASTTVDAAEAQANAYAALRKLEDLTEAFLKFNPATGQGFQPCKMITQAHLMQNAVGSVTQNASNAVTQTPNGPGQLTPLENYATKTLEEHYKNFCSEADKKAGLCSTVSALPNGDLDSSLLHDKIDTDLKKLATQKYIEYVVGKPTGALSKNISGNEADAVFDAKHHSDAMLSIPRMTLEWIRQANTARDDLGGKSTNELITDRVGVYFGGEESREFTRAMAVQKPRGLILEAVKMEGFNAWLRYQQYKQTQFMEMNLAALLLNDVKEDRDSLNKMARIANIRAGQ